jgi:hypothetical protein
MDGINGIELQSAFPVRARTANAPATASPEPAAPTHSEPIPATPPNEVLHALDRAAQVLQRLAAQDVHLHFEVGEDQKIRIQVVDDEGNVLRQIPQQQALDLLAGHGGLAVDARG